MSGPPRRTRRPGRPAGASGDRTRERVLVAAVETFARTGLAGTSVRDIAKRARIRVSTLYHYYPSKEALYHAVQERVHEQVRELVLRVDVHFVFTRLRQFGVEQDRRFRRRPRGDGNSGCAVIATR